jgi:hypothetical protein
VILFLCVTLIRSVRADFQPEIWKALLGTAAAPATFSISELWVALGVLAVNGGTVLIQDNRKAFFSSLAVCFLGILVLASALLAWRSGAIASFPLMVLVGLGLYLPYVAVHTTVFERILALTRDRGNVGFLMYVADSIGYLGYVLSLLAKQFRSKNADIFRLVRRAVLDNNRRVRRLLARQLALLCEKIPGRRLSVCWNRRGPGNCHGPFAELIADLIAEFEGSQPGGLGTGIFRIARFLRADRS